jgi:hypothetical protein
MVLDYREHSRSQSPGDDDLHTLRREDAPGEWARC